MNSHDISSSPVKQWWKRRSLKLRLAVCFTLVSCVVMLGLIPVVYVLIENRLRFEMDRQMGIDWNLIEAHLESDGASRIQWRKNSPASPSSPGYAETWFDVWAGGSMLLNHFPNGGVRVDLPPRSGNASAQPFYRLMLPEGIPTRVLQRDARIDGREVILRVFRDESGLRGTLREILIGLALGIPIAILLAASGAYLMAGRALRPLTAMTEQARLITSESLARRLPNPNPDDELGQLATVFNQTLHHLESSFEALKRFTADASHELRTPLTALRSVGEVALRDAPDPQASREAISSMLEEAQGLNDLIDTMLMFARIESGRQSLELETLDLADLASDVCESIEVLAAEKQQRIELQLASATLVSSDRLLLRHAVMNILHNAIRYSPPGTIIQVRCFQNGTQSAIEIADQGPGIAPEHQAKVFERFYRVDQARTRADGGAGLGLAIAKLSVERLGGSIELTSHPAGGCCFRITLPAAQGPRHS